MTPPRLILAAVVIGMMTWLLWPAGDPLWPVGKLAQPPSRIVVFGDSLTSGYQLREPQKSFPLELGRYLGLPVQVEGMNGCTLPEGAARLDHLDFGEPCLVLVCLGGNDQLKNVPQERSTVALESILKRLRAKGHAVIFAEVLAPFSSRSEEWRRICREQEVAIVPDLMDGLFSDIDRMLPDNIHPNEAGCALLAKRSLKALHHFGLVIENQ